MLSNCSYNQNSKSQSKNEKSENLMSLSFSEYKIFIDHYVKKSKYPDINQ